MQRRPSPRLIAGAMLLGLFLSQPGHALGYLVTYGTRSLVIESQGAHAYFPAALHLSLELLITLGLAAAAVLGLGRIALGRALGLERGPSADPRDLILVLAAVQLNVFVFQELAEVMATGMVPDTHWLLTTALAAAVGQLPMAVLGGLLLAWCSVRLRVALRALRTPSPLVITPAPTAGPSRAALGRLSPLVPADVLPPAIRRRGPPRSRSHPEL